MTLRLRATAPGLTSASASVATAVDDPDLTNNAATLSLIVGGGGDIDGDRLQDICEALFGLSVGQNDAVTDPDGDGLSNLEECLNGTHPRGFHQAYFAEGASGGGFFDATFTLANESDHVGGERHHPPRARGWPVGHADAVHRRPRPRDGRSPAICSARRR